MWWNTHIIVSKWDILDNFFLHQDSDPDHCQNLMGSKSEQDPFSDFLKKFQHQQYLRNAANKQTDKPTNSHKN